MSVGEAAVFNSLCMKQILEKSTSVSVPEFDDPIPAAGDYFRGLVGQPLTAYADRGMGLESLVDPGVFHSHTVSLPSVSPDAT